VPTAGRRPIRIGCSGWNYASWKQELYEGLPASRWLEHYARHFDTVEANNTFYRLPNRDAVANWERTAPPGFVFAVKASRYLTHVKRLRDVGEGLQRFYDRIDPLLCSSKLGPILWQLPPNFQRDDERHSRTCRASNCTASSSGIPRGSSTTSTRCFGATVSRS